MTTNLSRLLLAGLAAASVSTIAAVAQAQPWIRDEFMAQIGLPPEKPLPCSVCHAHGNTGIGSVRTPFGYSVRMRGLIINAPDLSTNVFDVIHKMNADGVDSDGDGVQDMKELALYTDPNVPGPVPLSPRDEVGYGCHCGVAPGAPSTTSRSLLLAVAAGLASISARRAIRRGRPSRA